jgi:hypothetical protein
MKVLIGCEESQAITIAFRKRGHEAYSCDLQSCSGGYPEWHLQKDVLEECYSGNYDLMIAHPPCTFISYAGIAHWNRPGRLQKRLKALEFFAALWEAPIEKICLENPKSCASPTIAKYAQEIQPYYFGDRHLKTTWLWLKNLAPLKYSLQDNLFETATATERPEPIYTDYTGKKRYFTDAIGGTHGGEGISSLRRSKTFHGIAEAMAEQWGDLIVK